MKNRFIAELNLLDGARIRKMYSKNCFSLFLLILLCIDAPGDVNMTTANFSKSTVNIGESTTLYCHADANPSPSYELLRDGVVIATRPATDQLVSFTIGPIALNGDGEYTCKAINQHGFDEVTVNLTLSRTFDYFVFIFLATSALLLRNLVKTSDLYTRDMNIFCFQ